MRTNVAIAVCLLSLPFFALCYERHWMSLGQAVMFAAVVWDFTGLWLTGRLWATLNRKVSDLTPLPTTPLAGTIMKGSAVLLLTAIVVYVCTWIR